MSPNDIKLALQEALAGGVSLNTSAFVIFICGSFLSAALGAYIGKYFGKRGETAAIGRDLAAIQEQLRRTTAATEEIKAQISGELWLKQKRWDIKWQCYSQIVENLGELTTTIEQALELFKRGPRTGQDRTQHEKEVNDQFAAAADQFQKARRFGSIARIAVAPDVRTQLSEFGNAWNRAENPEQQRQAARQAWLEVLDIARSDLFGEAREIQTKD